jgi:simple sugar transport system substrate-binding protein
MTIPFPRGIQVVRALALAACAACLVANAGDAPKLKVAFIYVGPIGDFGWTRTQDDARREVERELPWLETNYVESVAESDFENCVDLMVQQGARVIFAESSNFMDGAIASGSRHPDIMIFNGSGFKRAPNVATYRPDMYQCFYLLGLMAGGLTKTDKAGYVAGSPTPDEIRAINAFTLGLREVRPSASLVVRWINSWYDPPAAKEAAEALISEGADFLVTETDSPTVVEVAGRHHLPSNGFSYDMHAAAPEDMITGALVDWRRPYREVFEKIRDGTYTPRNLGNLDLWWRLSDGVAVLAYSPGVPINPRYIPSLKAAMTTDGSGGRVSVYDLVMRRLAQMSANPVAFEPYHGPIRDHEGRIRVPAGHTMDKDELFGMGWRVQGVEGSWPSD